MKTAFDVIRTTREQYIVSQVVIAAMRAVNSLHCASDNEREAVNEDINCIDKIACNVANAFAVSDKSVDAEPMWLNTVDQTIALLERVREAGLKGGLILKQ